MDSGQWTVKVSLRDFLNHPRRGYHNCQLSTVNCQLRNYLLLLLVLWSEYCLMEEILLSDSVMKAFSFSSNS